ncbi:MAG: alpha/beta hydrolase [Bacteroidales bacterium]|nr:alpha/beta hydrolase [Bacteroidales bacterium]
MKGAPMTSIGIPLLEAGFAVATINHRASTEAIWPAQIQDVKAAIRFVRAKADEYGYDNSFIGITGFSSGGHLSAYAAVTNDVKEVSAGDVTVDIEGNLGAYTTTSSSVDAVVDWFGPVDMLRMDPSCSQPKDETSPEAVLIGKKDPRKEPNLAKVISPLYYVKAGSPEILIIHGDADNVVPQCQSINLKKAYDEAGVKATFVSVEGGGHGPVCFSEPYYKMMVEYFLRMSR